IAERIGATLGATVRLFGADYRLVGIFDSAAMRQVVDLDGEGIAPPDYGTSIADQRISRSQTGAFRRFTRLDPSVCIFLPAQTALDLGGDLRSVAVGFTDPADTAKAMASLMPRLRLNLYASVPSGKGLEVRQFSILQGSKSQGLGLILLQLAIAGVFVFNTM